MAKYRFPGKALKLNGRRKIRYENWTKNCATEDNYSCQIVRGFKLFREFFGSSEEEGDVDFEGFDADSSCPSKAVCQRLVDLGFATSCKEDKLRGAGQTLDKRISRRKQNLPPTSQDALPLTSNKSEDGPELNLVGTRKKSGRIRKPSRKALEGDGGSEEYKSEGEKDNAVPTELCSSSPKNKKPAPASKSKHEIEITPLGIPSRSTPSPDREGGDRVSRNIALYAETISSTAPSQPTRPTRRSVAEANGRANQAAPALHIQEKIEKILQSPWDGRAKLSTTNKVAPSSNAHSMAVSKNILRKARLNLNKRTLQKIRNPVSVQNLLLQQVEGECHVSIPVSAQNLLLQRVEGECHVSIPVSAQNLLLQQVEELSDGSCGVCQLRGLCEMLHNTSCCQHCASFLTALAEKPPQQELLCLRECGGCQLVGISIEERCKACWLCRALLCCTLPSLLHDRMRKKLPQYLKEKIPTSLARSVYVSEASTGLDSSKMNGKHSINSSHGAPAALPDMVTPMFGSIVDLPGGWKRKTGPEVVVISPSGEKFKSIPKLEEYLQKLGICTDARVLFGGSAPANENVVDKKPHANVGLGEKEEQLFPHPEQVSFHKKKKKKKKKKKHKSRSHSKDEMKLFVGSNGNNNNCVTTTLPGGWIRRTIFRHSSNKAKFDVYVLSPDGRTFRSRKQLSAYFQQIGKVDDITKYFPLFHEKGSPTATSSERTETESSTEPDSSSELLSDTDANDVLSIAGSESEGEATRNEDGDAAKTRAESDKSCIAASSNCEAHQLDVSFASGGDASQEDFVGFDNKCAVVQNEIANIDKCVDNDQNGSPRTEGNSGDISCDNNSSVAVVKTKKASISFKVPFSHYSNEDVCVGNKKDTSVPSGDKQNDTKLLTDEQRCNKENTSIPEICDSKDTTSTDVQKSEVEVPKFKAFQTQHLGNGWSRKIKWSQDGTGKVSFVVTPAGSKIQSNLELQAYFKKEGGSTLDAAKFFPMNLKREDVPEKVAVVPRVCKPKQASVKKDKKKGDVPADVADGRSDVAAPLPVESSGGPRIKRVCRSLEQALGMPRATFPVLEDKENRDVLETESSDSVSYESASTVTSDALALHTTSASHVTPAPHIDSRARKKVKKQAKVYSVTLTATGKVLRKTMWCNKCSGCLVPNCRECVHCLDMIKYGGPGSKKKPCISRSRSNQGKLNLCSKRRCINPRLSVHSSAQQQQSQTAAADPHKLPNPKQAQQQGSSSVRSNTPEVSGPQSTSSLPSVPVLSAAPGKKIPQKVVKRTLKKMAEMQKRAEIEEQEDLADEKWRRQKKDQEKNVFVPQQIVRPVQEMKIVSCKTSVCLL
ncbi:Methyl-CpG DNA binding [Trinorchestia longiramus]|nr:Methyl-CpG DNA binding [Trinorchestia longiramus]